MIFSEEKRFVFVAVPKTGTTAIQRKLRDIDPAVQRNRLRDASGEWREVRTHATAEEIRALMGPRADDYVFVAFFRDPREVIRSKYFFYRHGRPAQALAAGKFALSQASRDGNLRLGTVLRVLFAKVVPLTLWALIYPFKSSAYFVTDSRGRIAVDEFGDFERLQDEVVRIFGKLGYDAAQLQLQLVNRSSYDRHSPVGPVLERIARLKLSRDISIYERIRRETASDTADRSRAVSEGAAGRPIEKPGSEAR